MKKHLFRITALLMVCCLLFAGCTPTDNGDSTTTESTTTTSTEVLTSTNSTTESTVSTTESTTALTVDTTVTTKPTTSKTTKPTTSKTTTTKSTTTTTESTTTATTKPTLSKAQLKKIRNQIGFGYYRMGELPFLALPAIEKEVSKGHVNFWATDMGRANTYLTKADELGNECMVWVGIGDVIFTGSATGVYLNYAWEERVREQMQAIEDEGLMEHVWGFYFDEPFLRGIKKEDFITVTKFLRETYPDLRVFTVFAVNAIDPTVWSVGNDTVIDEESTKYLTDIGYDLYSDAKQNINTYKKLNASMKENLGNNNPRIWWVPCIMSYANATNEQFSLDHLEMCYNFLKEEENPGGLYCYAYDIFDRDGDIGSLGYNEKQAEWTKLESRLVEIGKEIRSWKK